MRRLEPVEICLNICETTRSCDIIGGIRGRDEWGWWERDGKRASEVSSLTEGATRTRRAYRDGAAGSKYTCY